jgi:hypothetical protein
MIKNKNNNIIMTDEENKKKTNSQKRIISINKNSNTFLIGFTAVIFIIAIISLIQDKDKYNNIDIKYTSFIYVLLMFGNTLNDARNNPKNPFDSLDWIRNIFYEDGNVNIDKKKKNWNTILGYVEIGILASISLSGALMGYTFNAFFTWTFIIVYLVTNLLLMKLNKMKNSWFGLGRVLTILWVVGFFTLITTFVALVADKDYLAYDYGLGLIMIFVCTTVVLGGYLVAMWKLYLVDPVEE